MKKDMESFRNTPQGTMFLPLLARARCEEKYPGLFRDPGAAAAARELHLSPGDPLYRMADSHAALYGLRQDMLVWSVRRYLKEYPEAVIVNLGCGLDTSFEKADNGRCRWVELDLPEAAELRRQLLPPGERERILACHAADLSWMEQVDGSRGMFAISGGALYYLQPEQVKRIFCAMAETYPGGGICFDCQSRKALLRAQKVAGAAMHFAVDDAETLFRPWSQQFGRIETISRLPGKYLGREFLPLAARLLLRQRFGSGMMKFVEIRFRKNRPVGSAP